MNLKSVFTSLFSTNNTNIGFFLLCLIVSTFPLLKVNNILIFSLFVFQVIVLIKNRVKITFHKTVFLWMLIGLYTLNIIGLLYTELLSTGFNVITRQITFILFPLFFCVYKLKNINLLLKIYVIAIFCFIVFFEAYTLFHFFYRSTIFPLDLELFFSSIYTGSELIKAFEFHKAYFGMYIAFSNVIIIDFIFKSNKKIIIFLLLFLLAFQSFFILQMIAKTAILINGLIVLISVFYFLIKRKQILALVFFVALLFSLTAFVSKHFDLSASRLTDRFTELKEGESATRETRVKLWNSAIPIIKENLFFGVGTGDADNLLHKEYEKANIKIRSNIHNQYLDYLLKFGIFGLSVFIFILLFAVSHSIKSKNYIYFCFTLLIIACCVTENILSRQWGIIFYGFFNYLLFLNSKT